MSKSYDKFNRGFFFHSLIHHIEGRIDRKKMSLLTPVAERKNFKLLFSAGIILAVEVSILYFRPMRMI